MFPFLIWTLKFYFCSFMRSYAYTTFIEPLKSNKTRKCKQHEFLSTNPYVVLDIKKLDINKGSSKDGNPFDKLHKKTI